MPRPTLGPRLWLQPARYDKAGKLKENECWIIRDGKLKRGTGCSKEDRAGAENELARYILTRSQTARERDRDTAAIGLDTVLAIYAQDCAMRQARPKEVLGRIERLGEFFGKRKLSEVNGALCRAYVAHRKGRAVARRELEDLRAAIIHHRREGLHREIIDVVLPAKGKARERWLTRREAARLLWAAWRIRQRSSAGGDSKRRTGRHVARFILVGLYTGTRAGAICNASFVPDPTRGYVDLERGVFYRRAPVQRPTKKRQPPVPIPARLLAHMRRWRAMGQQSAVEWHGEPVGRVSKAFRSACGFAKLGDDVTPHVLRHTCCTWLMQRGVPIWTAAGYAGMSEETLRATYGHHHPDHLSEARDAITAKGAAPEHKGNIRPFQPGKVSGGRK